MAFRQYLSQKLAHFEISTLLEIQIINARACDRAPMQAANFHLRVVFFFLFLINDHVKFRKSREI